MKLSSPFPLHTQGHSQARGRETRSSSLWAAYAPDCMLGCFWETCGFWWEGSFSAGQGWGPENARKGVGWASPHSGQETEDEQCWPWQYGVWRNYKSLQVLLYSTRNSAQCYVAAWMEGESGGQWIYVYVCLNPFAVYLKLTQHR